MVIHVYKTSHNLKLNNFHNLYLNKIMKILKFMNYLNMNQYLINLFCVLKIMYDQKYLFNFQFINNLLLMVYDVSMYSLYLINNIL